MRRKLCIEEECLRSQNGMVSAGTNHGLTLWLRLTLLVSNSGATKSVRWNAVDCCSQRFSLGSLLQDEAERRTPMKKLLPWLGAVAVAAGLTFACASSSQAAPAQSALPGLESIDNGAITPIHCRRHRHCHDRCVRRNVFGVCRRLVTDYCHRC